MAFAVSDLAVLLACMVCLLLNSFHEGDPMLTPAFFAPAATPLHTVFDTYKNGRYPDPSERLPPPLITDVDGDGLNEVVMTTRDPKLVILRMRDPSTPLPTLKTRGTRKFNEDGKTEIMGEVSLLSKAHKVAMGRQPVAIATGYISPPTPPQARTQVIVVLTEGWVVLCFDHKLNLLWEQTITPPKHHYYFTHQHDLFIGEAAININVHGVYPNDTGLVLVGGRSHPRRTMLKNYNRMDSELVHGWKSHEEEEAEVAEEEGAEEGSDEVETLLDDGSHGTQMQEQHFTYYAFEAKTGSPRWQHKAPDFYEESGSGDLLHPQHESHAGEMDWTQFRPSLLHSLPHTWERRDDTKFKLMHFVKRRAGRDRHKDVKKKAKAAGDFSKDFFRDGTAATPVAQLSTGGWEDEDDDLVVAPNVLLAHLEHGIEAVHLYTGRAVCHLPLQAGKTHSDINADSIIEHLEGSGSRCTAIATAGIPPTFVYYNGSLCMAEDSGQTKSKNREPVQIVAPLVVPLAATGGNRFSELKSGWLSSPSLSSQLASSPGPKSKAKVKKTISPGWDRVAHNHVSVYLANTGVVTAFGPWGGQWWQTQTEATWNVGRQDHFLVASLTGIPLRTTTHHPEFILVAGEEKLIMLNLQGSVYAKADLSMPPLGRLSIGDIDGDGINDILVPTKHGVYAFTVHIPKGSLVFSALLVILGVILLVIMAVKTFQERSLRPQDRRNRERTGLARFRMEKQS